MKNKTSDELERSLQKDIDEASNPKLYTDDRIFPYLFFRIKERKYSSNIIEGGNYNKEGKIVYTPILSPLVKKEEGDKMCEYLFEILNN